MPALTEDMVRSSARVKNLEDVKRLNCWGMELTDISVLQKLPNLEVLSLSVNSITSLKDVSSCKKLSEIYLRKNKIEDISEIGHLKGLPNLKILWISDNPFVAQTENYRQTLLRLLPRLVKLDNQSVAASERHLDSTGSEDSTGHAAEPPRALPTAPCPVPSTGGQGAVLTAVLSLLKVLSREELALVSAHIASFGAK